MPLATVNGISVIAAEVAMPRLGRWTATFDLDTPSMPTGPLSVKLGAQLALVGTVHRGDVFLDAVKLLAVGGSAGILRQVKPKSYRGIPLRIALQDALADVGETLASSSDADVTGYTLQAWARMAGPAGEELLNLVSQFSADAVYRVLPDGSVWVGRDAWPEADIGEYDLIEDHPGMGRAILGVEEPALLPGTTFRGRKVEFVNHSIRDGRVRTAVQYLPDTPPGAEPVSTTDRNDINAIVDRRTARARYMRTFPARVVSQNGDLSLELQLDSPDMPGLSGVPIRTAVPGLDLKVKPNARCHVAFENGNPQRPVVTNFERDSVSTLELVITAVTQVTVNAPQVNVIGNVTLNGGVLPVARATDVAGPYPIIGGNPTVKA